MRLPAEVTPAPVQLDSNNNPVLPKKAPTATATPTAVAPLTGADARAALGGQPGPDLTALANQMGIPLADLQSASGTTAQADDPPLLWKPKPATGKGRPAGSYNDQIAQSINERDGGLITTSSALSKIYESDAYRQKVAEQMVAAGILDPTQINDLGAIQSAWEDVVNQASLFYQAGNGRTPEQVIAMINMQKKAAAAAVPTTVTHDTTQAQTFNTDGPGDIRTALINMLGRAPTEQETQSYMAGLNSAAQANPQQSHSVVHTDANGNTTTNTTNSGGIDPTAVLGQMAQADPEYGAYQASTTYMDALRQAIGAFVG